LKNEAVVSASGGAIPTASLDLGNARRSARLSNSGAKSKKLAPSVDVGSLLPSSKYRASNH